MKYIYNDVRLGFVQPEPWFGSDADALAEMQLNRARRIRFQHGRIQTVRRPGEKMPFAYIIQIGIDYHIFHINGYRLQIEPKRHRHLAVKAFEELVGTVKDSDWKQQREG